MDKITGKCAANPTDIIIDFEAGNPVSVNGKELSPAEIIRKLNHIGVYERRWPS